MKLVVFFVYSRRYYFTEVGSSLLVLPSERPHHTLVGRKQHITTTASSPPIAKNEEAPGCQRHAVPKPKDFPLDPGALIDLIITSEEMGRNTFITLAHSRSQVAEKYGPTTPTRHTTHGPSRSPVLKMIASGTDAATDPDGVRVFCFTDSSTSGGAASAQSQIGFGLAFLY